MEKNTIFFAICYILYGIFKIIISIGILFIPLNTIESTPIVNYFNSTFSDKTTAGVYYDYVISIFGVYTILTGLALLNCFSPVMNNFFENKYNIYYIYTIFGLSLLIFYLLVLYTDLPISKNLDTNKTQYEVYCYSGGLSFLALPLFWYYFIYVDPIYKNIPAKFKTIIIITVTIILTLTAETIYHKYYKNNPISTIITTARDILSTK